MAIKLWEPRESASARDADVELDITEGGPLVFASWRTPDRLATADHVRRAYRSLDAALTEQQAVPIQERVFGSLTSEPCVARGRADAAGWSNERWAVPPTFIEGAPPDRPGVSGIHVIAVRSAEGSASRLLARGDKVYGRLVMSDTASFIGLSDLSRSGAGRRTMGPVEETGVALNAAIDILASAGFAFTDVARTWFYLRDILNWYGAFNAVRSDLFERLGLIGPESRGLLPASTGIGGRFPRGGWCDLDLLAVRPRNGMRLGIKRLYNRRQNEATEYGSAFARGVSLTIEGYRYIFISGTAAIDESGATVHRGDFAAQVRRTLDNVTTLLGTAGATPADLCQGTAFIKHAGDYAAYRRIVEATPYGEGPIVETIADVCRDDLLYELDAVACVPLHRGTAA